MHAEQISQTMIALRNSAIAEHSQRFFKTGPGEYGEGDRFLGLRMPVIRHHVKLYRDTPLDIQCELLQSDWHEIRMLAVLLMVEGYKSADEQSRLAIYQAYMTHLKWINNWDLVDASAHKIIGPHLLTRDRSVLDQLVASDDLWQRRIAMMTTFHFIKQGDHKDTIRLATRLLTDPEDLIHKAVGWMLREVGKQNLQTELDFLDRYYPSMPRTMLRYAIEKLPEPLRLSYLQGTRPQRQQLKAS